MPGGYRSARQCPECASLLSELALEIAVVDHCTDCGGLWIDWFDGEISTVAASARGMTSGPQTSQRDVGGSCPDCRALLTAARYPNERDGAEILRCGSCAGAFVPRRSLDIVVGLGAPPDPALPEPSRLQRLWAELRRLFATR